MILDHVWGMFAHPKKEWETIRDERGSVGTCFFKHVMLLAAIPPIAGFIGTTQFGWQIGAGAPIKLTVESALWIAIAYYFSMLVAVATVGWTIQWMSKTYGAEQSMGQSIAVAAYTATPLFLIGIMEIYPVLWLNFIIGLPALAYSVYLLYAGVPIVMEIPPERGFLFSSAILAFGLVALVAMLAITAALWVMGLGPSFTS